MKSICIQVRFATFKGIQDSLGFWIPRHGFRKFLSVELGFWIQSLVGSRILRAVLQIPDFTSKNLPDSGIWSDSPTWGDKMAKAAIL